MSVEEKGVETTRVRGERKIVKRLREVDLNHVSLRRQTIKAKDMGEWWKRKDWCREVWCEGGTVQDKAAFLGGLGDKKNRTKVRLSFREFDVSRL